MFFLPLESISNWMNIKKVIRKYSKYRPQKYSHSILFRFHMPILEFYRSSDIKKNFFSLRKVYWVNENFDSLLSFDQIFFYILLQPMKKFVGGILNVCGNLACFLFLFY